jgi:hypothetical protein
VFAKLSYVGIALMALGGCSTPRELAQRDSMNVVEATHRATTSTTDLRARITELELSAVTFHQREEGAGGQDAPVGRLTE